MKSCKNLDIQKTLVVQSLLKFSWFPNGGQQVPSCARLSLQQNFNMLSGLAEDVPMQLTPSVVERTGCRQGDLAKNGGEEA